MGGGDTSTIRALKKVVITSVRQECRGRGVQVARRKIGDSFNRMAEKVNLGNGNLVGAPHLINGIVRGRLAYYYMELRAAERAWGGVVSRNLILPSGQPFSGMVWADELLVDALARQLCPGNDDDLPPPPPPIPFPGKSSGAEGEEWAFDWDDDDEVDVEIGERLPVYAREAVTEGAKVAVGLGGAYLAYRLFRMIPSVAIPPLWPTIPVNAAIP